MTKLVIDLLWKVKKKWSRLVPQTAGTVIDWVKEHQRRNKFGNEDNESRFGYTEFEVPAKYSGGELGWICLSGATDLAVLGISVVIQPGR